MRVRWLSRATKALIAAHDYIAQDNPKAAREFFRYAIASADRDEQHAALAIHGLCVTAAERGDYMCRFDRAEYVIKDFDHMVKLGFAVEWDCGTIYVRWA